MSRSGLVHYRTDMGGMIYGSIEESLENKWIKDVAGNVDLILTSPPFPLNRKKRYGNKVGEEYLEWLRGLAPMLRQLLSRRGSLVIEIGNAWEPGRPEMSTLPLEALMAIKEAGNFTLCQYFVCHNPSRLPGPVEWVNKRRCRVKDSFTNIWWLAKGHEPKADNRRVLAPYSDAMRDLIGRAKYNDGRRPSGWKVGSESFLHDNGGSIPPNALTQSLLDAFLVFSNTQARNPYLNFCKEEGYDPHPARMQPELAAFFIRFLTEAGDLVVDPFAGANTSGAVAEALGRRWLSVETKEEYVESSMGWFAQAWSGQKGVGKKG